MTYLSLYPFCSSSVLHGCPCGYFGSSIRQCKCTPNQVERYVSKISGPLLDRIDIHIDVPAVSFRKLRTKTQNGETSQSIRKKIESTRTIQAQRFGNPATNASMTHKQVEKFCLLDDQSEQLLKTAMAEFALSARAHDKICKVARTIADLEQAETIKTEHIAEAISYRKLDRQL